MALPRLAKPPATQLPLLVTPQPPLAKQPPLLVKRLRGLPTPLLVQPMQLPTLLLVQPMQLPTLLPMPLKHRPRKLQTLNFC